MREHSSFYVLQDPLSNTALRIHSEQPLHGWHGAARGVDSGPLLIGSQWTGGQQLRDFIWTTGLCPLVSARTTNVLAEQGITGWDTYEVRVLDRLGDEIPGCLGLSVTGRCRGAITFDRRESAIRLRPGVTGKLFPHFVGLKFDQSSWDGSDLFMGDERTLFMLATQRVVNAFKKHRITNCRFMPVDDIELLAVETEIFRGPS